MLRRRYRSDNTQPAIAAPQLIASTVEPFLDGILKVELFATPDGQYLLECECSGWWWHVQSERISAAQAAQIFESLDRRTVSRAEAFPQRIA